MTLSPLSSSGLTFMRAFCSLSTALMAACASVDAIVLDTDIRKPPADSDDESSSIEPGTSETAPNPDPDSGFPTGNETVDTGEPFATDSTPDTTTDVTTDEPDTEFVCSNNLQCTLKWFGTICCDKRCINPTNNVEHCGRCNNDCMADRRGNSCLLATCNCGPIPNIRCQGEAASECCTNMFVMWACGPC